MVLNYSLNRNSKHDVIAEMRFDLRVGPGRFEMWLRDSIQDLKFAHH